ncbi:hypothetical protein [Odoribacter sp. AF15-53]|uniref:golvesin C-terminal-like domain-containing protein n=1 Tax=Odoribacter sp. AF15-53 TaxID=2292236 RepID=UPI000E546E2A|nr:hypothetical protein [Odoribacter sp. AF15-53]RHR78970.1 hypothetical protein DWW52_10345 [Odoribacter sp. AF15-53]
MNFHNIRLIARYESKYICRNPVFLGIALSGLIIIFIMQNLLQGKEHAGAWFLVSLSSAVPFINAYLFMILQSVLVILATSEWRTSEKRADTLEALRVHPFNNLVYITGKTLGVGIVLLVLNLLSMLLAAGINLFASDAPFDGLLYLFYGVTLSFPAMLFLTGLATLVSSFIKNRALTILLLTGFITCTMYYLTDIQHGMIDYMATTVPNVFSEVLGHVAPRPYITQRIAFLALGIGCLGIAATRQERLPDNPEDTFLPGTVGIVFPLLAITAGAIFYLHYKADGIARDRYRETGMKFADSSPVHVPEHAITFKQEGESVSATSHLRVINREGRTVNKIILFLNPALNITRLAGGTGNEIPFQRENQVIVIEQKLQHGEILDIQVDYQGTIDDRICYLDSDDQNFRDYQMRNCPLYFGKRYAYMDKEYTLLTPECLWYPTPVPTVNLVLPCNSRKDFTRFSLSVIVPGERTVISQGSPRRHGDTTSFSNRQAMHGLTLCTGLYERKTITIDSVNMELYTFKKNNTVSTLFKDVPAGKLEKYVSDMKERIENYFNQPYPYDKFLLAETPVSFNANRRRWENQGDFVQPEIVLFPERWINLRNLYPTRFFKDGKQHETIREMIGFFSDETREERFLKAFTNRIFRNSFHPFYPHNIFIPDLTKRNRTRVELPNEQCLQPLFDRLPNYIYSDNYPVMNKIIFLLQTSDKPTSAIFYGNSISLAASRYLSSHCLKEAITDPTLPEDVFLYILKLKTRELVNLLDSKNTSVKTQQFISEYKRMHSFRELDFNDLNRKIKAHFEVDLDSVLPGWYEAKEIPAYTVRNIQVCKIEPGEFITYQVSFEIQNNGKVDGFISLSSKLGEPKDKWQIYHVPAGSCWNIKKVFHEKPEIIYIDLNLSRNLPSGITQGWINKIMGITSDTSEGQFTMNPREFLPDPTEIIVDNEDPGFRLKSSKKKKLGSPFNGKKEKTYIFDDASIYTQGTKLPVQWTSYVEASPYYGNIIKSCLYKTSGKGDSPATWAIELPNTGRYEIFIYVHPAQPLFKGIPEQYYTLTTKEGIENVTLKIDQTYSCWASIGVYELQAGENSITLSDKGVDPVQMIFADAVKWKLISK